MTAADGRRFVLRRLGSVESNASLAFKLDLRRFLRRQGWPVALPRAAPGWHGTDATRPGATPAHRRAADAEGSEYAGTVVRLDAARLLLLPAPAGRPPRGQRARRLERLGAVLAHLHQSMAAWDGAIRRAGVPRLMELDILAVRAGFTAFRPIVDALARQRPEAARRFQEERTASLRDLARGGYYALPLVPVHGSLRTAVTYYRAGHLTGLGGLETAHVDTRLAEIARTAVLECAAPDGTVQPADWTALLHGVTTVAPLTPAERPLLLPVLRAALLFAVAARLAAWQRGRADALDAGLALMRGLTSLADRDAHAALAAIPGRTP